MVLPVKYIADSSDHMVKFSVCSMVRDNSQYDQMVNSFEVFGFTSDNSEFIAADNRTENNFDGYNWQRRALAASRGEYVVFCHEDVELIDDSYEDLITQLNNLDKVDPNWLLAGVAGGAWRSSFPKRDLAIRISDPYGENQRRTTGFPQRVETLDECFIVMRRDRPVLNSYQLNGFHFYGPDLCLQAELLGGSCYVMDFHLRHHSGGKKDYLFRAARHAFEQKYTNLFPGRNVHVTTGKVSFGEGHWQAYDPAASSMPKRRGN